MLNESVRQRAIRYINELQESQSQFKPYQNERGKLGQLISLNYKSKSNTSLHNTTSAYSTKKSNIALKERKLSFISGSNSINKLTSQKSLDLSQLADLQEYTEEEQAKALQYKEKMEKKALLNLLKYKQETIKNPYLSSLIKNVQDDVVDDKFFWNMNNIDKGKNLAYLFHSPKIRKHNRKVLKIDPAVPSYNPNYESIQPKQMYTRIKANSNSTNHSRQMSQQQNQNQQKQFLRTNSQLLIPKKDKSMEQMYNNIQNQINQEVKLSMIKDPIKMNPLEEFSAKHFDEQYLKDFKYLLKTKLKETALSKKKMQEKMKDFLIELDQRFE